MTKLFDLGEEPLIAHVIQAAGRFARPGEGPGDDAAVIYLGPDRALLFCIDTVTEAVHFRRDISTPFDIGWKSVAVNLSDIAAMGGKPTHVIISICAPGDTEAEAFYRIVEGALECSKEFGARLVGGDTTESPVISITGAALGEMPDGLSPVLRSGARPGDAVMVTGRLGEAELGRRMAADALELESHLVLRHRRPIPRVEEGIKAARLGATAMIDISDGLLLDAGRLAASSGVRIEIDIDRIPIPDGSEGEESVVEDSAREGQALRAALVGGEDFELLFTIPDELADSAVESWGSARLPITRIGRVTEGAGVGLFPEDRIPPNLRGGGWEHFRR